MLEPQELFSQVSGLEVTRGTEAEILCQIRRYQKTQAVKSDKGREGEEADDFEFCWEESQDKTRTPSRDIPGHARPKPAKSPRSPRSPKAPECSRSPRSPKSPRSPVSDIVGLADDDLRKLKLSIISDSR